MDALQGNTKADLYTINFQALLDNDSEERSNLLDAAQNQGFFYLDLTQTQDSAKLLGIVENVYSMQKKLFDLPLEEKLKYDVDNGGYMKINGYKPKARNFGGVNGKKDGFESWALPKDGVLGLNMEFSRPQVIQEGMSTLTDFMRAMQLITGTIHNQFSTALGLQPGQRFEDFHRRDQPSPCLLRLLKYHPQPLEERGPPQTPHTDLGTLTVLFTEQPGLQVLPKGAADWTFVEPKPGHAIINIGDGLSMMTNGLLQSCLHRVGPLPNKSMDTRYSFAYLQRAEEHTQLTAVPSSLIPAVKSKENGEKILTSGEWLRQKFGMLRAKTRTEDKGWVLTGRVEALPS